MENIEIELTSVTDKAVGLKLPVVALEEFINKNIKLADYGSGLEKIFFVFIAVPPENTIHEEYIIYTESDRHLEIAAKLDYDAVLAADLDECMKLVKELFLEAFEACHNIGGSDFDWVNLSRILKHLFG